MIVAGCIDGHVGRSIDDRDAAVALGFSKRPSGLIELALSWYLDALATHGVLRLDADGRFAVQADFHDAPPYGGTSSGIDRLAGD